MIFSSIRLWIRELIYGRKIPKQYRYIIIDIEKFLKNHRSQTNSTPVAAPPTPQLNKNRPVSLPIKNISELAVFIENNKDAVYKYMMSQFEWSIENKKKTAVLFQLTNNPQQIVRIHEAEYSTQLSKMLKYFVETENYELAARCRDLLNVTNQINIT